jgi:NAD(P)-dependent dehydrogenase (short-subunit alcohol dehydrogenase family)
MKKPIALIVGGTSGLGLAICRQYVSEGYIVVAIGRSYRLEHDKLSNVIFLYYDLMNTDYASSLLSDMTSYDHISIIVYNIGGSLGLREALMGADDYYKVMQLNFFISLDITKLLYDLLKVDFGRIIYILSASVNSFDGYAAYVVSKGAAFYYIKSVASVFISNGVSICGVCPTSIDYEGRYFTKLSRTGGAEWDAIKAKKFPIGRLVSVEEVVSSVMYLSNRKNAYLNGSILNLDGGAIC